MTFKQAVEAAQNPVIGVYFQGKQAMESKHRGLVMCEEPPRLAGSIDLDAVLRQQGPNDHRRDYGLDYKPANVGGQAIRVEIFSAATREVSKAQKISEG